MITGSTMRFFREHSFSITLGALGVGATVVSRLVEHGSWAYDMAFAMAGVFLGCAITAVAGRYLWERGCDPSQPPE
jgi:hypothetical protein